MTFTFIIMDSLYIMRNLLMIFFLMVVFWTNLGNCEGGCDRYTQCHYNETRMHSTVSCNIETARGNTAPPCYGDGSNISCSCKSENYQLSSPDNSHLCRPDEWEDGLYDLHCLRFCDKYTQCHYDETRMHSTVSCTIETAGDTSPPCYGDGSNISCSCKSENYQLSSPNNSYLCRPDRWQDGLYDLHCLPSPCDEPAPRDDLVFHSPDFAEGEMYPNGTEIMYDCPDKWDLNGHMTAVCLYGVWTYENVYCTGFCDKYTQCHYDETWMHSTVSCNIETARGNTEPPCYGDGSNITCSCDNENYQLSSPDNSYLCRPDKWEDGLYDLHCLPLPCDEPAPQDDLVFHSPDFAEGEMYAHGTHVMYDCPDGFDLNGQKTAVCLYGVWTHEDAYCTASPCDEPAPQDDKVFHSPDFAEGEMYANGTEIMYYCRDGFDLNGHKTAVCLYGVWTYEDAYCTALPCDEPAPQDDLVFHSLDLAEGEMYAHGTKIMYDCPDGFNLNGHMTAVCLYGVWTHENAYCTADCDKSTDCKSEQKSVCDRGTGSCACPPGKTFQNEKCLVERIIRSSLQLEVEYKEDFANKSSRTLEQEIRTAFEETFKLDDKFNNWFVSCEVETIQKSDVHILADVVTRYDEDVAVVTPEYFDTHIQNNAQSGLRLNSIKSEEGSYNACKEGTDICDPEHGDCIYHGGTNYECRCKILTTDRNRGNPALHGIECDPVPILLLIIIAIYTLLFAVLLIWLVKMHCLRRGTKWIPSVEGVANEQVPPTANDESKFVSKVIFEMRDPNAYQNDVNKEENDVTDHVGDNSPDDSPNNDPEEETV